MAFLFGKSVKKKEELIFYPSYAYFDVQKRNWVLEIQGHVFEKKENSKTRKWIVDILQKKLGITNLSQEESIFKKQIFSFLVDNQRLRKVSILIKDKKFKMEKTRPDGKFRTVLFTPNDFISAEDIQRGVIDFQAILKKGDDREILGKIYILDSFQRIIISDIDDTIKISNVRNKKELLKNVFRRKPEPVLGMPEFFRNLQAKGRNLFFYISASPWQLYASLLEFLQQNQFPEGVFVLKKFRLKDKNFFNIFKSPGKYKFKSIEPLLQKCKTQKFILIGDSGEEDAKAFVSLYAKYPNKIEKILIRNSYPSDSDERTLAVLQTIPARDWIFFKEVQELDSYLFER